MLRMVAKGITDCLRLSPITKLGRCGMRIQVSNCGVSDTGILQREFHPPTTSSPILGWRICVKSVRIRGVAHKLREPFGASVQSVFALFKNNHPRPFTEHKSIPLPIPWARRSLRIIVSGRERPHRGKARNRQWRYGSLASSTNHDLCISPLYDAEGFSDSMRPRGTCSGACDIGAFRSVLDRDLSGRQVYDGSRDEEWRYTRRSLRDEFAVFSLDHFEGADAASDIDTNPLSIFGRNMKRSLSRRVMGSRHRELDEASHFLHVFSLDEVFRHKTLYLACKSARIIIG